MAFGAPFTVLPAWDYAFKLEVDQAAAAIRDSAAACLHLVVVLAAR